MPVVESLSSITSPEQVTLLQKGWDMTRNQKLHVLHVDSAQAFAAGQALRYIRGDTLLFDFVYFLHPVRLDPHSLYSLSSLQSSPLSDEACGLQDFGTADAVCRGASRKHGEAIS